MTEKVKQAETATQPKNQKTTRPHDDHVSAALDLDRLPYFGGVHTHVPPFLSVLPSGDGLTAGLFLGNTPPHSFFQSTIAPQGDLAPLPLIFLSVGGWCAACTHMPALASH
jgi:hypothetical protein